MKPTESGKDKSDTRKPKATGKLDWSKAKKAPEAEKKNSKDVKVKKEESPPRKDKQMTPTKSESESPKDSGKVGPFTPMSICTEYKLLM